MKSILLRIEIATFARRIPQESVVPSKADSKMRLVSYGKLKDAACGAGCAIRADWVNGGDLDGGLPEAETRGRVETKRFQPRGNYDEPVSLADVFIGMCRQAD